MSRTFHKSNGLVIVTDSLVTQTMNGIRRSTVHSAEPHGRMMNSRRFGQAAHRTGRLPLLMMGWAFLAPAVVQAQVCDYFRSELRNGNIRQYNPGGGHFNDHRPYFRLDYMSIPKVVRPGEKVVGKVGWTVVTSESAGAIVYKTVLAEWSPNSPIAVLQDRELDGSPRSVQRSFSFRAPTRPGSYRIRLAATWAYCGISSFYGDGPKGNAWNPGIGDFAEVSILVKNSSSREGRHARRNESRRRQPSTSGRQQRETSSSSKERADKERRLAEQARRHPLGVAVETLTNDARRRLGLFNGTYGVRILYVATPSPAARAGLRAGMIIESVDHRSVANKAEFDDRIRPKGSAAQFAIGIWQKNARGTWTRANKLVRLPS